MNGAWGRSPIAVAVLLFGPQYVPTGMTVGACWSLLQLLKVSTGAPPGPKPHSDTDFEHFVGQLESSPARQDGQAKRNRLFVRERLRNELEITPEQTPRQDRSQGDRRLQCQVKTKYRSHT